MVFQHKCQIQNKILEIYLMYNLCIENSYINYKVEPASTSRPGHYLLLDVLLTLQSCPSESLICIQY